MVAVIPIRFKEKDLKKVDELVKNGVFKSRSEAIRNLSLEAAESKYADLTSSDLTEAVKAILDALKEDRNHLRITVGRKAAKFIAEGRERL